MVYLNSIEQVRSVEWGRGYLWDVKFENSPEGGNGLQAPDHPQFKNWFPAVSVEENVATLASHTFDAGTTTYIIPFRATNFSIQLTFHDDDDHFLLRWFEYWVNHIILNESNSVSPIADIVRPLSIVTYKDVAQNPLGNEEENQKRVRKSQEQQTLEKGLKAGANVAGRLLSVNAADKLKALRAVAASGVDFGVPKKGSPTDLPKLRDKKRVVVEEKTYLVYPDTTLSFQGGSEANIHQYTVNLIVAGKVGNAKKHNNAK